MSQLERIAFIDRRIRGAGGVTLQDICGHFEISSRQAKRDIEYMRGRLFAEIEYSVEKRGYYYISIPEHLNHFNEKTLLFYMFMKRIAENMNYLPVVSESLLSELSRHISRDYLPVSGKIEYDLTEFEQFSTEDVYTVLHSIADKMMIHLTYRDSEGALSERLIEPARLINYSGKWYVVAFDHSSGDFRTFLVSRFVKAALSKEPFSGVWDDSRVEKYLSAGFGIYKSDHVSDAVIRFYKPITHIIENQIWHDQQKTSQGTDEYGEYFELTVPVGNFEELLGKVLRYGSHARIIAPDEFRWIWINEIRRMGEMISGQG